MSIEIAQKYGVGVTYKGDDGTLYFKDEAGNVTSLTQADQLAKVSSNDTTAGYLNGKLVAGSGVTLTENNNGANETLTISTIAGTDELLKVSSNDTTAGYLNGKLVAGSGVTLTENNNGANETLTISTVAGTDELLKVSSNDTTAGYLNGKLVAGSNITLTENNNGGNETLTIAAAAAPVTSVNTKTGAVTLTNTDVGAAATSHTHAASDITSGTIATARLGSGTALSSTFLAGDQSYKTPPYPVTSVAGKTGVVTLTNTDVGAAATSHTHAASDITSGTIATARLGSGTADNTTFLRGDNTWAVPSGGGGGGGFSFYDVTLADVENTTTATDVAKITIPANSWEDGQSIVFDLCYDLLNQSGGTVAPTILFGGTGLTGFSTTGSWNNSGTIRRSFVRMIVFRNGSGTYTSGSIFGDTGSYSYPIDMYAIASPALGGTTGNINLDSSVDFTSNIDLYYRITFPTAHASLWLRPWNGCAYKTQKGASL